MIEMFGIVSTIFIIVFFVNEAAKGFGRKISAMTAPNSGCSVTRSDDLKYYTLAYLGPKNHIEFASVGYLYDDGYWNEVESLDYERGLFVASIIREDYRHVRFKKEKIEAITLKKLSECIEKKFQEWNYEHHLETVEKSRNLRLSESMFLRNTKTNFAID
jgi:hypothetical protein